MSKHITKHTRARFSESCEAACLAAIANHKDRRYLTVKIIAMKTGLTQSTAQRTVNRLHAAGRIKKTGIEVAL